MISSLNFAITFLPKKVTQIIVHLLYLPRCFPAGCLKGPHLWKQQVLAVSTNRSAQAQRAGICSRRRPSDPCLLHEPSAAFRAGLWETPFLPYSHPIQGLNFPRVTLVKKSESRLLLPVTRMLG